MTDVSRIEVPTWILILGAVALAAGAIYSRWKLGSDKAASNAAEAWKEEVAALTLKVERLSDDLAEAKNDRKFLEGQVAQLSTENSELKKLIMGDKVPAALTEAIGAISQQTIEAVERIITSNLKVYTGLLQVLEQEYLEPIHHRLNRRTTVDPEYRGPERRSNGRT